MLDRKNSLSPLLAPKSVAIVGASDNVARIGGRPLRYLREGGFQGAVYPVNPNRETVQGLKSYPSVADLPETPDVAILAVPAGNTLDAVRAAAARGVPAAIVFSAGFAEVGEEGRAIQEEMASLAREAGMRLIGPNCLGVFNSPAGYYGTFSAVLDGSLMKPGALGVVSQSGAYGSHIAHLARERGMGISHWITTGNECDVDVAEALRWMVEQPDVNAIVAYAEGIRDADTLVDALEIARLRERAIIFMKVGRSDVGAEAVSSHTAALSGSDAIFDAVFRQYGVWRAQTTAEQLDIAYACARGVYPKRNSLGIFTLSGGFGIQMADDAAASGLDVKPMPEGAQAELKSMLPYASPKNPVDATAQALTDLPLMTNFISAMLEKGDYDFFAGIFGMGPASPTFAGELRKLLETASEASRDTIMGLTMSAPADIVQSYDERGFLVHEDGSALMKMFGALVHFRQSFDAAAGGRAEIPDVAPVRLGNRPVSEVEAKEILAKAGIPFLKEKLASDAAVAAKAAAGLGFPVVIKICSPDIIHKTEIGGVAVGIRNEKEAAEATDAILESARRQKPGARIDGVIVSPMAGEGVEIIAGVTRDPVFGPVVMFGLGGIFVEVLKDVTFRRAPFDAREAHRMIREIKGYPVLEGARGALPSDIDSLADMLSSLSVFAAANADTLESVDLNPVRVMKEGGGVIALDALIIPRASDAQPGEIASRG